MKIKPLTGFLLAGIILLAPAKFYAQEEARIEYVKAKVLTVSTADDNGDNPQQTASLNLLTGPSKGDTITIDHSISGQREDLRLIAGQTVVLQLITQPDGATGYHFREFYRLPALGWLLLIFLLLGVIIGKKKGIMSLIGLAASFVIILRVIFPLIAAGGNPFLVSIAGSFLIAGFTMLISHGLKKRTWVALLATCITLIGTIIMAKLAVLLAHLFGLGSEESIFLQLDPATKIDPKGLLLAGIVIGALGVLDDITTAQVAAIDEVNKANPAYGFKKLYQAGLSVGHEHVASMINTLVLAYAGASLPLLMMFYVSEGEPVWVLLNSAFLAEEIVRTLVGSAALLLAIPVSTWLGAFFFSEKI